MYRPRAVRVVVALPCMLLQGGAPATTPAKPIRTLRPQQVLAAQPVAGEKRIALVIGNGACTRIRP